MQIIDFLKVATKEHGEMVGQQAKQQMTQTAPDLAYCMLKESKM